MIIFVTKEGGMGEFSLVHIIVVGILVLILFGSDKLPVFGQSLGKAIKGFKQGLNEADTSSKDVTPQVTEQKTTHTEDKNKI